jgi:hypothetical protein
MPIADNLKLDFQLVVEGTFAPGGGESQEINNVLTYRRTTTGNPHSNAAFITAWRTAIETAWLAAVSEHYDMDQLRIRCLNDAEDAYADTVVGSPGAIVGEALPGFNAMVISKRSAIRGRWAQGRIYICGIPEAGTTGNALTAGQLTLLTTLAAALNTAIVTAAGANTYVPTIFSQEYSQIATNPTDVLATEQSTVEPQPVIGRMSSRRSRVG